MKIASRSYKYARVNKFLGKHIIWSLVKCFLKLLEEFKFVVLFQQEVFLSLKFSSSKTSRCLASKEKRPWYLERQQ
ncbi:MAG: hypothetical protein DRP29_08710 [Thermodesulfobacteriota bacterium]|nr:MAG: hypothetical protein DRP29_08710 [Thermodesulfobacteriota bacterium]